MRKKGTKHDAALTAAYREVIEEAEARWAKERPVPPDYLAEEFAKENTATVSSETLLSSASIGPSAGRGQFQTEIPAPHLSSDQGGNNLYWRKWAGRERKLMTRMHGTTIHSIAK